MNQFDYLFKFICIGDIAVGKSCIVQQYAQEQYRDYYETTIGVEFASKILTVKLKKTDVYVKTQIWDTAGQESFKSITRNYYKGAIAGLLVFDVSKRESFENLKNWYQELLQISDENIEIVVIGNKCDLLECERQVTKKEGEEYAKSINKKYFECSAKTGANVNQIFQYISDQLVNKIDQKIIDPSQHKLGIRLGKRKSEGSKYNSNSPIETQDQQQYINIEKMYGKCTC